MKIAKSSKNLVLPREFSAIEERGRKTVIAKDFFFGRTSLSLLPLEWYRLTVKYQSYFVKGTVADYLALGLPTNANVASWEKLLKEVVFGKFF